jgi:hypothetical protein
MTEFDSIIAHNYKASAPPPEWTIPADNGSRPEPPERKSLTALIVSLALLLVVLSAAWFYYSQQPLDVAEPVRAGFNCMDDAGGGVYCWKPADVQP